MHGFCFETNAFFAVSFHCLTAVILASNCGTRFMLTGIGRDFLTMSLNSPSDGRSVRLWNQQKFHSDYHIIMVAFRKKYTARSSHVMRPSRLPLPLQWKRTAKCSIYRLLFVNSSYSWAITLLMYRGLKRARWHRGAVGRVSDLRSRVKILGKFVTPMCLCHHAV